VWTAASQTYRSLAGQTAFLRRLIKPNSMRPDANSSIVDGSGMGSGGGKGAAVPPTLSSTKPSMSIKMPFERLVLGTQARQPQSVGP